ncbi:MAG: PDZ domain-containing protein [Thermoguttaceae bacterium]
MARDCCRALMLLAACVPLALPAAEIYVSPDGVDANPGTRERPLATIAAARDAVRSLAGEPVTVWLGGGTYYLEEPLVFKAADSRGPGTAVRYAAEPGKTPVLSGGCRLELEWKPAGERVFQAAVPEGLGLDQLFVDGTRQPMARWPNFDAGSQYFQGFSAECTSAQRVARWADPAGGFLHAMHRNLWGDMHWTITGKTADGGLEMVGGWQNNRQMGAHATYRFVENVREELDAPGEWYLDRGRSILYFCPPEGVNLRAAKIEAVRLRHLVEFRGSREEPVRHIGLEGLTFTHAARTFMENREPLLRSDWTTYRGGAIVFEGAEDCALGDCWIDQVGGNGIFVSGYNRGIRITGCRIAGAGASGVSFVGDPAALRSPLMEYGQTQTLEAMDKTPGPRTADYPAECLVDDCLISSNGRVEKQTAGVNVCMAESITVRHTSIYDCPRAGINICDGAFGGHVIEYCDVFDTVKETGDHGSFNSWGRDRFWNPDRGQTARWVAIHPDMPKWDCGKANVLRNNRWRCDHGWDIDLDDGSSHYEITNNLCLAGGLKLREGYFRDVSNNVLVDYTFCPHVWYPDCHSSFRHNIVWQDGYAPAGMETTDQGASIDENLVHRPGSSPHPAEGLMKFGGDRHSVVADAMFVDAVAGDYRVREGSPALALGFKNFAMDRFGVQKPQLKALAKTSPLPGTLEAARIESGGWGRRYGTPQTAQWLGATVKGIADDGEMSALGLGDRLGVVVAAVAPGSRAEQAGLKQNDVIRGVGGRAVRDLKDFAALWKEGPEGGTAPLAVWRNQGEMSIIIQGETR